MNTYRAFAVAGGLWQVYRYEAERLIGPVGPKVATKAEALFIVYRLARAEIIDPPSRPVWDDNSE